MKLIKYQKSYSQKKHEIINKKIIFVLIIFFIFVLLIIGGACYYLTKKPVFLKSIDKFLPYIFVILILIIFYLKSHLEDLFYEIKILYKGEEGEDKVINLLKRFLDHRYIYIANYNLPNIETGDIDGLIIGPKGLIVLEIKNYPGVFRIGGLDLYRKIQKPYIYRLYFKSPVKQVLQRLYILRELFKDKNVNIKIIPIVVLVSGEIENISGLTDCFVMNYRELSDFIYKLPDVENWSDDLSKNILNILGITNEKSN